MSTTPPVSPSNTYVFVKTDGTEENERLSPSIKEVFNKAINEPTNVLPRAPSNNSISSDLSDEGISCTSICKQVAMDLILGFDKQIKDIVRIFDPLAFKEKDD